MITHIRGKLVEKNTTHLVVEAQQVGYFVHISLSTHGQIPPDENVFIYTHLIVREDAHILFGFHTKLEREIFQHLISVSGIGPNTARTMLSSMSAEEVIEAIGGDDVRAIQSVKGIGAKTAQRVIIDLKDKISKVYSTEIQGNEDTISGITTKNEAIAALEALGYTRKQTERHVQKLLRENTQISTENIIKQLLKTL